MNIICNKCRNDFILLCKLEAGMFLDCPVCSAVEIVSDNLKLKHFRVLK